MREAMKVVIFVTFCVSMGLIIIGLVGCAGPGKSRVEMDYGTSRRLAIINQTANPEAAKNLDPVTGMDGRAAKAVVERYDKGFEKIEEPKAAPINITIGK